VKFLADMGISPRTVYFLKNLGHDAVHLSEQKLHRLVDDKILRKARDEGRVLLTHDLDFGDLMAASSAELPSVIIFRLRNMHPNQVNRYLEELVTEYQDALEKGAIISVVEGRIRLRNLPIVLGD
jgi:predicted nuclease of predicted toxin-antitoxin system